MKTEDTLLIGFDRSHGSDKCVLVVGRKQLGESVEIINAFQGDEALEIYKKLVTKNGEEK